MYRLIKFVMARTDPNASLEELRAGLERLCRRFPMPKQVAVEETSVGGRYAEWLRPEAVQPDRVILYLHGGAYTRGSCATHRALAARIGYAAEMPVLLIDYRLAPEHPFPAAIEDAAAAFEFLDGAGFHPEQIAVAGDSAGGGLSLALVQKLRREGRDVPGAVACLSPWADLTLSHETVSRLGSDDPFFPTPDQLAVSALHYAGGADLLHPGLSPVNGDFQEFPPLLIQVGGNEILLGDSLVVAERARAAGGVVSLEVWEGMWHVWQMFAGQVAEASEAVDRVGVFLNEHLR